VKKRVVKERLKFDKKSTATVQAEELEQKDLQKPANETGNNVLQVEKLLERYPDENNAINLFKFVINPHDFAESVENIFYLSFLIRDGKCVLEWSEGENPEPIICERPVVECRACSQGWTDSCEAPAEEDYQAGLTKQQLVLEFDMETWEVTLLPHAVLRRVLTTSRIRVACKRSL